MHSVVVDFYCLDHLEVPSKTGLVLYEVTVDFLGLYALFSQFRPRNVLQEICFSFFHRLCIDKRN